MWSPARGGTLLARLLLLVAAVEAFRIWRPRVLNRAARGDQFRRCCSSKRHYLPSTAALALRPSSSASVQGAAEGSEMKERIRASVPLSDVIKQHVDLDEKGDGQWMGCCPFHDDKSPSMSVSDDKGLYHCFSCGAGGDIFSFVSNIGGLSFPEAMELLADEAGIDLVKEGYGQGGGKGASGATKESHARLHQALEAAGEYYASMLLEASAGPARTHLQERGFSAGLASDFGLGYAPVRPGGLLRHLGPLKLSREELVKSGLFSPRSLDNPSPFDRLSGRLIIPIRNARGQMVAFGGRLLDEGPLAKYLNTPETPVFKKRNLLFGAHVARAAIREKGTALVVEGYFDVMALHGAGLRHAVACMGTAVTGDHVKTLQNALPSGGGTLVLVLDRDKAGQRAAARTCRELLLPLEAEGRLGGLHVKVAQLPEGSGDPDDLLRAYAAGWGQAQAGAMFEREVVNKAMLWKEWYARLLMEEGGEVGVGKAGASAGGPHASRGDTAAFSRRSEALTDFLARLPATQQADRTFLCSLLAREAFPSDEPLRARVTSDLLQQCDEKHSAYKARETERARQQQHEQQLKQQQQKLQQPQRLQQSKEEPAPRLQQTQPPGRQQPQYPHRPPQRLTNLPAPQPSSAPVARPQSQQSQQSWAQYTPLKQTGRTPAPERQGGEETRSWDEHRVSRPSYTSSTLQGSAFSSPPSSFGAPGLGDARSLHASSLISTAQGVSASRPRPPPQKAAPQATPLPSSPPPSSFNEEDSKAIFIYEQSLIELLIADPRARARVRDFLWSTVDGLGLHEQQPPEAQQLMLSTHSHQLLLDWLMQADARTHRSSLLSFPPLSQNPASSVARLKQQFEMDVPAFPELLSYFDRSLERERVPHSMDDLQRILRGALAFLVNVTVARRVEEETEFWQRRLLHLEAQREGSMASSKGHAMIAPPLRPEATASSQERYPYTRGVEEQRQERRYFQGAEPRAPYQREISGAMSQSSWQHRSQTLQQQAQLQQERPPSLEVRLQQKAHEQRGRWPSETGEGLNNYYNSVYAQREAQEAYLQSQRAREIRFGSSLPPIESNPPEARVGPAPGPPR
ncbi:dna primase [Nannochloropsis gaditana]|uniref:Dna primase n=1 Tax=Nannochloropsis gaditana TaxID=72520 RepID=W7TDL7_9STRA|nr:dna primase [Nannochloropsis gaditana]